MLEITSRLYHGCERLYYNLDLKSPRRSSMAAFFFRHDRRSAAFSLTPTMSRWNLATVQGYLIGMEYL